MRYFEDLVPDETIQLGQVRVSEAEIVENKERVRELFVRAHQELRCA